MLNAKNTKRKKKSQSERKQKKKQIHTKVSNNRNISHNYERAGNQGLISSLYTCRFFSMLTSTGNYSKLNICRTTLVNHKRVTITTPIPTGCLITHYQKFSEFSVGQKKGYRSRGSCAPFTSLTLRYPTGSNALAPALAKLANFGL